MTKTAPRKFVTVPAYIEAIQHINVQNAADRIREFCGPDAMLVDTLVRTGAVIVYFPHTRGGQLHVSYGEWLCRNSVNEYRVLEQDRFDAMFEEVIDE